MKKLLILITSGAFISAIPLIGAYVYHNGPEWVRTSDGMFLTFSCILSLFVILMVTIYYFIEDI